MWKVGQKLHFFFQMSAILTFDFSKQKTITFFRRKLSKLHKKDTILHVTITFSLKQGQTGTRSGPIWVPLTYSIKFAACTFHYIIIGLIVIIMEENPHLPSSGANTGDLYPQKFKCWATRPYWGLKVEFTRPIPPSPFFRFPIPVGKNINAVDWLYSLLENRIVCMGVGVWGCGVCRGVQGCLKWLFIDFFSKMSHFISQKSWKLVANNQIY